jgi:hypothetical protein
MLSGGRPKWRDTGAREGTDDAEQNASGRDQYVGDWPPGRLVTGEGAPAGAEGRVPIRVDYVSKPILANVNHLRNPG